MLKDIVRRTLIAEARVRDFRITEMADKYPSSEGNLRPEGEHIDVHYRQKETGSFSQHRLGDYHLFMGLQNERGPHGQDAVRTWSDGRHLIMVTADGVGGAHNSQIAAKAITTVFVDEMKRCPWSPFPREVSVRDAMDKAQASAAEEYGKSVAASISHLEAKGDQAFLDIVRERSKLGAAVNFVAAFVDLDLHQYDLL